MKLRHLAQYSFDPHLAKGNCESFTGAAQVPVGFAGPLRIDGEHAQGDFLIPLATSEGTLVASSNRGMKALNACGGVKVTVVDDAMQRAPVFVFPDTRAGRDFARWMEGSLEPIRRGTEYGGAGHICSLQLDSGPLCRGCELLSGIQFRHGQEGIPSEHDAHARQAGDGGGHCHAGGIAPVLVLRTDAGRRAVRLADDSVVDRGQHTAAARDWRRGASAWRFWAATARGR